jgi:hypothetical protein
MVKSCGECSHSLENIEREDEVYCIANSPTPIVTSQGNIISMFPSMMMWGKCDNFKKGKTQQGNKRPPKQEILEPELKVVS